MEQSSAQAVPVSDADLIRTVASGDAVAYVAIHQRHVAAARALASRIVPDPAEAEDVLSGAFAMLLKELRSGRGPSDALRPYLLTAVRRVARERQEAREQNAKAQEAKTQEAKAGVTEGAARPATPEPGPGLGEPLIIDPVVAGRAATPLARSYLALPQRLQAAVWHTLIERSAPVETTAVLGLAAEGVAQLAVQARTALIAGCLALYRDSLAREDCKAAARLLDAGPVGTLSGFDEREVQQHIRDCRACRAAVFELADLSRALRHLVAPVILGSAVREYLGQAGAQAPAPGLAAAIPAGPPTVVAAGLPIMDQAPAARTAPRPRRVLAGGGLLAAALAAVGLALVLAGGGSAPQRPVSRPAAATAATPSPGTPAAPATVAAKPRHRRHRKAATVSQVSQPSPTPARPSRRPSPSPAAPSPTPPSPTVPVPTTPPVPTPSPWPPWHRHHHPRR